VGDRYEIGDLIGRGGMADVYRAHDTVLDRAVAVKVLRHVSSPDTRRFADEANLLAALDDDAIITLLDAGITEERPWLALELVEGRSLRDAMASGPLDPRTVQRIGHDVASGLAHAHGRGVVHRDVKPSNVMLTAEDRAKLTDFGIARLEGAGDGATLTGHTIGTAAYLSPEQVRSGPVTGAADVYALGLVLLEALTAVRAYPGPATEAALARLHHSPLIPTSLPPGWPGLIAAMTAAEPGDRPSAADVAGRLGAARFPADVDLTTTVQVLAVQADRAGRADRADRAGHPRRRLLQAAGAAAVLVLAVALTLAQSLTGEAPAVADGSDDDGTARAAASSSFFFAGESATARTTSARVSPAEPTVAVRTSTTAGDVSADRSRSTSRGRRGAQGGNRGDRDGRSADRDRSGRDGAKAGRDRSGPSGPPARAGKPEKRGKPREPGRPGPRADPPGKGQGAGGRGPRRGPPR
jgi:hypothetical protein